MRSFWNAVSLGFVGLMLSNISAIAVSSEGATFESFYVPGLSIGFWGWAGIVIVTVVTAVMVAASGGTASPTLAYIASLIGGASGLSGVAATNFGLALLGGGAVSVGGFGMAGGVVVLTAALTFSGEVVLSYAVEGGLHHFEFGKFEKDSRSMIKLPPVRTVDGPKPFEKAMAIIKGIDLKVPLDGDKNEPILRRALEELERDEEGLKDKDRCRVEALRAIMYSQLNDYPSASASASKSVECGNAGKVGITVPLFIKALCAFAETHPDVRKALDGDFRQSIANEPENKMIPMLYSVLLDRFQYRYLDGSVSPNDLEIFCDILDIKEVPEEIRDLAMAIVYARTVILLKLDQQFIYGVGRTESKSLKGNPSVKEDLERHFHCYVSLVGVCENKILPKLKHNSKLRESSEMLKNSASLITQYREDELNLEKLVAAFGAAN